MTEQEFKQIVMEEGVSIEDADGLWDTRPEGFYESDENTDGLRETARTFAPLFAAIRRGNRTGEGTKLR